MERRSRRELARGSLVLAGLGRLSGCGIGGPVGGEPDQRSARGLSDL